MRNTVRTYLSAFGRSFTYDLRRNAYLWFGFLWGIPVPIVSLALDCSLCAIPGRTPWDALLQHPVHFLFLAHPFLFALVFGAMGTVRQRLEEHNAQLIQSLTDLATTDSLTGLHNRRYVLEELHKALQRARRIEQRFAVVLFDLDGFKYINDTLGHAAGDVVLRKASAALQSIIREGDVLGRYGGDEFLLITYGDILSAQSLPGRADDAVMRAAGLGTSAGVARHPEDGATAEALIERADAILAENKKKRYAEKGTSRYGIPPQKSMTTGELPAK
ncbi:MAG: GGDEF domain-containing protein [Planctomycetes bacterium]|nr:GGDEF domain-containing protein [Planctomycetota bacterium]